MGSDLKQYLKVRQLFIPMTSRPLVKPSPCTKFRMVCSKDIPMVTVFRTSLNRQVGLLFSWPEHSPLCNLHPQRQ